MKVIKILFCLGTMRRFRTVVLEGKKDYLKVKFISFFNNFFVFSTGQLDMTCPNDNILYNWTSTVVLKV